MAVPWIGEPIFRLAPFITFAELYEYLTWRSLNSNGISFISFGLSRKSALETDLDDYDGSMSLSINKGSSGLNTKKSFDGSTFFAGGIPSRKSL